MVACMRQGNAKAAGLLRYARSATMSLVSIILQLPKSKENQNRHSRARQRCRQQTTRLVSAAHELIKVRKFTLFGRGNFPVWMSQVIKFERVISVHEVLLPLSLDFFVAFDSIKKLGAVTSKFRHSRLISCFFIQHRLPVAGQIFSEVDVASESSGVKNCASDHHCYAGNIYQYAYFFNLSEELSDIQDTVSVQRCPP